MPEQREPPTPPVPPNPSVDQGSAPPATATSIAAALAQLERERAARRVAECKARRRTAALAGMLLGAILLAGGGWAWLAYDRAERQAEAQRMVEEDLAEAERLREQARTLESMMQRSGRPPWPCGNRL